MHGLIYIKSIILFMEIKTKVCTWCKEAKAVSEFHLNSRSQDGLHSYCKDCNSAKALAHIKAEKLRKQQKREAAKLQAAKS